MPNIIVAPNTANAFKNTPSDVTSPVAGDPVTSGPGELGTVFDGFQALTNDVYFTEAQLTGTISCKAIKVDGTGGLAVTTGAGDIVANHDVIANTGNITALLGDVVAQVGNISAAENISSLAGDIIAVSGIVQAGAEVRTPIMLTSQGHVSGTTLPTAPIPLGEHASVHAFLGSAVITFAAGAPVFQRGVNVKSIRRHTGAAAGIIDVILNITPVVDAINCYAFATPLGLTLGGAAPYITAATSLTGGTLQVTVSTFDSGLTFADTAFQVIVFGE